MKYWLVKSEPVKYPIEKFAADGQTYWDGVRNYQARIHLNAMEIGDLALFYHSNEGKEIVGLGRVIKTAYPDHTAEEDGWVMVDLAYEETFPKTVTLAELKAFDPAVKVVIASGFTSDHRRQSLLDAGAMDAVNKPFSQQEICETLIRAINSH